MSQGRAPRDVSSKGQSSGSWGNRGRHFRIEKSRTLNTPFSAPAPSVFPQDRPGTRSPRGGWGLSVLPRVGSVRGWLSALGAVRDAGTRVGGGAQQSAGSGAAALLPIPSDALADIKSFFLFTIWPFIHSFVHSFIHVVILWRQQLAHPVSADNQIIPRPLCIPAALNSANISVPERKRLSFVSPRTPPVPFTFPERWTLLGAAGLSCDLQQV